MGCLVTIGGLFWTGLGVWALIGGEWTAAIVYLIIAALFWIWQNAIVRRKYAKMDSDAGIPISRTRGNCPYCDVPVRVIHVPTPGGLVIDPDRADEVIVECPSCGRRYYGNDIL